MRLSMILICSLLLIAACGSQGEKAQEPAAEHSIADTPANAVAAAEEAADAMSEHATEANEAAGVTTTEAVAASVEGTLGCGHCNHQIGTSCSAAVQTAEGTVYILEGIGEDHEAFQKRFDGGTVKVSGASVVREGINYLTVDSIQL